MTDDLRLAVLYALITLGLTMIVIAEIQEIRCGFC